MIRRGFIFTAVFAMALLFSGISYAQTQQITNGLNYLTSIQNTDGSWGADSSDSDILPTTVSVMETLQVLNQTNTTSYSSALLWLQSQELDTTDYLSERIHALSIAGTDKDLLISYLDSATYAWGGDGGPDVDNLDTIYALHALKSINHPDLNTIGSALGYLISTQNPDGGWGFSSGDDSNVYTTALVLGTFSQYQTAFDVKAGMAKATAYLLTKQNTDGGFGSGGASGAPTSTVFESASTLFAIINSNTGQGNAQSLQKAINYLTLTQLPDGSWDEDPYSTALAIRALALIKPNLSVSVTDITFSTQTPSVGSPTTITATIRNTGPAQVDSVLVRFFDGDPAAGGTQIGPDQMVTSISAFGSATVSVPYSTTGKLGRENIFVTVDPANAVAELSESDNITSNYLTVLSLPDLYINSAETTFTPTIPTADTVLSVTFVVRNLGETPLSNVPAKLYNGKPGNGGVVFGEYTIPAVGGYGQYALKTNVVGLMPGTYTLYLVVDPDNSIGEADKTNNSGYITIKVEGFKSTDLSISSTDITFHIPAGAKPGDSITISALVKNSSSADVQTVVFFYNGDPLNNGTIIGNTTITVPAYGVQAVVTSWIMPSGNATVYVVVDPDNLVPETDKTNNTAFRAIDQSSLLPDFAIQNNFLSHYPLVVTPNTRSTIYATAVNLGGSNAALNMMVLYDGDPDRGGVSKGYFTFPTGNDLPPMGRTTGTITLYSLALGDHDLYVVIDPNNNVKELNEGNNRAILRVTVANTPQYDLYVSADDIKFSPQLPVAGQKVLITATVHNAGNEAVQAYVSIYNGDPRHGGQLLNRFYSYLLQDSSGDIPVYFTMTAGIPDIYVVVDENNLINETDETNNMAHKTIDTYKVDLSLSSGDISLNPVMPRPGDTVSVDVKVHSVGSINSSGTLKIFNGTPESGTLIGTQDFITSGSLTTPLSFPAYLYPGDGATLTAVIENVSPAEDDLTNNRTTVIYGEHIEGTSNEGTDFWLAWPPIGNNSADLVIQSKYIANISATIPQHDGPHTWKGTVSPGSPAIIPLMDNYTALNVYFNNTGIENKGIHVTSDRDISVVFHSPYPMGTTDDSYLALPTNILGTEYYILSYYPANMYDPSAYSVVVVEDNTNIAVGSNVINLNKGQIYHYNSSADLSGTHINSDKPIAVFSSSACSNIPSSINFCDALLEQMIPVSQLGTDYYSAPLYSPGSSDVFRVLATADNTEITMKYLYYHILQSSSAILNKGQWIEFQREEAVHFTSTKPIMVMQYAKSIRAAMIGDPFQMTIIPTDKLRKDYRFYTYTGYEQGDYISVIAPESTTTVMLDGVQVSANWAPLPEGGMYAVIAVNEGEHMINADRPVAIYSHGYGAYRSYGHPGGFTLPTTNLKMSNLGVSPSSISEGQLVEFSALLTNNSEKWAQGVLARAYYGDPANGGIQMGQDFYCDIIHPGESKAINFTWDSTTHGGTNNIYIVADPLNTIRESDKSDNAVMASVEVSVSSKPDPTVEVLSLSKNTANAGEAVTVTATIRNRGLEVGNIPVGLYLGDPATGGTLIQRAVIKQMLLPDGQATVAFDVSTIGLKDMNDLYVVVDPDNVINELREDNNIAVAHLAVVRNKLSVDVITDKTQYQAKSDVGINISILNENTAFWTGTGELYVEDPAGNQVAHIASFTADDLKPTGIEGWGYRAPLTVTKTTAMQNAIGIAYVNFGSLFSSLGLSDKTFDINSVRMIEFDSQGNFIGEKNARFDKNKGFDPVSNPSGRLLWLIDGITPANTPRYFYLYFDTLENGPRSGSLNTNLPEKGRLLAIANYYGSVYTITSNGDGTFGSKKLVDTLGNYSYLYGIALADFDNDGFPDIISCGSDGNVYLYRNKADGSDTFLPKVIIGNIGSASSLMPVTYADFNNDGNLDFIINMYGGPLYVFLGNGDGTFTHSTIPGITGQTYIQGKTSGDFNKDGNIDLAVSTVNGGFVYLYTGNGDGTFGAPVQINNSVNKALYGLNALDLNGDGYLDILESSASDGTAYVLKGTTNGAFMPVESVPSLTMDYKTSLDIADIDSDGNKDVIAIQMASSASLWKIVYFGGNGSGMFGQPAIIDSTPNSQFTAVSASKIDPEVIAITGTPERITGSPFNFVWNTATTYSGQYKLHVTLSDGTGVIAEDYSSFEILPGLTAASTVSTDKISYGANENVKITSTVTSTSGNYILSNLSAMITIINPAGGQVYSGTTMLSTLSPGQITEFDTYWNTGTNPGGTYPVRIEVKDTFGTIISTNLTALVISSSINPKKALKGNLSVDKQSILQGEPVSISYGVSNIGNVDISSIGLSVLIVDVSDSTVYDTLTDQTSLLMGAIYGNSRVLDTQRYTAKDYMVVLRAVISGTEETLGGTYFRVEGAPSAPSINEPAHGSDVQTIAPSLIVNNATDPNDDRLTYQMELYADRGLSAPVSSIDNVTEGNGITTWRVPLPLTENSTYYWRARAFDGRLYGEWMPPASFRVNVENDVPTAPTVSAPADNTSVDIVTPMLSVNNAYDPDSSNLTYNFEISQDAVFTSIVASEIGVPEGIGTTLWRVPVSLQENTWYYWRAQADDWLATGPWMAPVRFFVNTANDAPSAPLILTPADGSGVATVDTNIVVSNSTDPDSATLTYLFEVDTVASFDSVDLVRSGNISEGQATTLFAVASLRDNTTYCSRAKASDGLAESPWSSVSCFFVNTSNDAPTAPVLANPSNGSGVKVFNPLLSVHNSMDLDNDPLIYEFEVYGNASLSSLVAGVTGISETPDMTSWTISVNLTENSTYYWRARAYDGQAYSPWMPVASFMVNTANDAPGAPSLNAPSNGVSLATLSPTLAVNNAIDPDSDSLTYDFEVYAGSTLLWTKTGISQNPSGITSVAVSPALSDNTAYTWRGRAYDGDRYGAWMDMASFSTHMPSTSITVTIEVEPETLNRRSNGNWVMAEIELPKGYHANDVQISSIRLEGVVPAVTKPYHRGCEHDREHHRDQDNDHDDREIKVKFDRDAVLNVLPNGEHVKVHVSGIVGTTTFEGVDTIRVMK